MKIVSFLFLIFLLLNFCFSTQAQQKTSIQLTGRIFALSGAVIQNIEVAAYSQSKVKYERRTNEDGIYVLDLPEGIYTLVINEQAIGFETVKFENYRIVPAYDGKMNLDVPLSVIGDGIVCILTVSDSSEQLKKHKVKKKKKN